MRSGKIPKQLAIAQAFTAPAPVASHPHIQIGASIVKLKDIADGARTDEILAVTPDEMDKYRAHYAKLMREHPSEGIEPSVEQVSALSHIIRGKYAPYVD